MSNDTINLQALSAATEALYHADTAAAVGVVLKTEPDPPPRFEADEQAAAAYRAGWRAGVRTIRTVLSQRRLRFEEQNPIARRLKCLEPSCGQEYAGAADLEHLTPAERHRIAAGTVEPTAYPCHCGGELRALEDTATGGDHGHG